MALTKRDIEKARKAEQEVGPRVTGARYLRATSRVEVTYDSGVSVTAPVSLIQELAALEKPATASELAKIEVSASGRYVDWPKLDVSVYAPAFMKHIFGNKAWVAAHASGMGSVKSPAKAAAARENGKKGGRPRKDPVAPPAKRVPAGKATATRRSHAQ
jgi:hypothetical protein